MVLIHHLAGYESSSPHDWLGVCSGCHREVRRRDVPDEQAPAFMELWRPFVREVKEHRNERVVEPGQRRRFDWAEGVTGIRTPDRVIRPQVDPAPLGAVVDVLRGGPGRVVVNGPDGEPAYWFDWADLTLREFDGGVALRIEGDRILDGADALVWTWDSLYLRGPDGAVEQEVSLERLPDNAGWRTMVGPFDDVPRYEVRPHGVYTAAGEPLLCHGAKIPRPVALWLALRVRPGC
jgi:hypothetical protein